MKISESWLRDLLAFQPEKEALVARLTMSGLEVDSVRPAAEEFSGVVVGRLLEVARHPDADKLSVCRVDAGQATPLQIVCGADNVYAGMSAPLALVGARLPGGMKIKRTRLRGVESRGMLCSARELGFGDDHSGIMDLSGGGQPGDDLRELLDLDDRVIEVDLTPNRGDCLGMEGIAREVAAAFGEPFSRVEVPTVAASTDETFAIELRSPDSCPRYAGRVVRGIDPQASTPLWMAERLRRAGLRPIHPVVDVTNYVMLELGQPMHGFDLDTLDRGVIVRRAEPGETLVMLDGQEVPLSDTVTVIADHSKPLAIAGVMGGEGSGVRDETRNVFFESAFFAPRAMAGVARTYGMHTDASHRFERGVDPRLQERAIERATGLLLEIAGGRAGPVCVQQSSEHLSPALAVSLRARRLEKVLGVKIPDEVVGQILERLGMPASLDGGTWTVRAPSFRFDITIEEDLIEEVARLYGYENIPEAPGQATLTIDASPEERLPLAKLKGHLISRGYHEAITYSFIDESVQAMLMPEIESIALSNPIASNQSHMRVSLWPGLLQALKENLSHRQDRVRLFESGMRFMLQGNEIKQDNVFSGLIAGRRVPEQWCSPQERSDFYDIKGDVESLLAMTGDAANFMFKAVAHPALHPGRSTALEKNGRRVGWLGELHPAHAQALDIELVPMLFEIELQALTEAKLPVISPISRFPEIRRDIAMLVPESVTAAEVLVAASHDRPEVLSDVRIFDVYRGDNIDSGLKSIALGLILKDSSRTLTDEEADAVVVHVADQLKKKVRARIRG